MTAATWKVTPAEIERRSEERVPASGTAIMLVYDELGPPAEVRCEFVDRSNGGCKLRHQYGDLVTGDMVALRFGSVETRAIVVWSRAVQDQVESGFSFLR